ncbi:MAG: ribonuclease HI [Desulfosalsimonadaceae bacterium]
MAKTGSKKNYYAVFRGRKPGIYTTWYGEDGAYAQVHHFPGAVYKGFATKLEAMDFLDQKRRRGVSPSAPKAEKKTGGSGNVAVRPGNGKVVIHTDGGALNNPGPGGYGGVIDDGEARKEISGGFRRTTNNRMELMAAIKALEALEAPSDVILFSDSKYVVDAVSNGWAEKWRRNNWMRNNTEKALNPDLWERLLDLLDRHRVEFRWVRGHSGNPENERCDELVRMESAKTGLPPDEKYEENEKKRGEPVR